MGYSSWLLCLCRKTITPEPGPPLLHWERNRTPETNTFTSSAITSASSLSFAFQNILHSWFKGECAVSQSGSSDTKSSMCPTTCWWEDGGWRPRKSVLNTRTDGKFVSPLLLVLCVPLTSFSQTFSFTPPGRLHRIPPRGPGHCWYLISLCLFPLA